MKKVLLTLMVVLSIFMVAGCGKQKKNTASRIEEEKIRTNINENVIKEVNVEGLKIERASLVYENGKSVLTTAITNVSGNVVNYDSVDIIYRDANGATTVLTAIIGGPLAQNQTVYVTSSSDVDLTKAVSVEYQVRK